MGAPSIMANYNKVNYYEVTPKIVRTKKTTRISIKQKYITKSPHFELDSLYFVQVAPVMDFELDEYGFGKPVLVLVEAQNGEIVFDYYFESEQDYILSVWKQDENGENRVVVLKTLIYALDEDLYDLVPLKGNTHLHSCYSDGLEAPAQHISNAFRVGFDYIALTDHNNYMGSLAAREIMERLSFTKAQKELTVLTGEEFSCSYQPMHIISLGASKAIDKEFYLKENTPVFENKQEQINWIMEQLNKLCDEIHKHNGVAVLCHPYWKPIENWFRKDAPEGLVKRFMESGKIDAYELVSGSPKGETHVSRMQHQLALEVMLQANKKFALLGQSDSHIVSEENENCIFPYRYTIAFCRQNTKDDILDAIKNGLTVAVEENDGRCDYYGSLRLIKFCRFLESEYFKKARAVKNMYHYAVEMCITSSIEDGKRLFDALDSVKLFGYADLKEKN